MSWLPHKNVFYLIRTGVVVDARTAVLVTSPYDISIIASCCDRDRDGARRLLIDRTLCMLYIYQVPGPKDAPLATHEFFILVIGKAAYKRYTSRWGGGGVALMRLCSTAAGEKAPLFVRYSYTTAAARYQVPGSTAVKYHHVRSITYDTLAVTRNTCSRTICGCRQSVCIGGGVRRTLEATRKGSPMFWRRQNKKPFYSLKRTRDVFVTINSSITKRSTDRSYRSCRS